MAILKQNGEEFQLRNSNHKYFRIDDLDWLYAELLKVSIGELSKRLNIPYNSLAFRVRRYFSPEQIEKIVKQRRFHKKKKTLEKLID